MYYMNYFTFRRLVKYIINKLLTSVTLYTIKAKM